MNKEVLVFTDGACRGNPGPGGWAAIIKYNAHEKILKGAELETTNNRMELMAPIAALDALKEPCKIIITTDSQYVKKGITEWIHNWKQNGWKNSQKKPVKNKDLWQLLDQALVDHDVEWRWVKGHAGHPENEQADYYANLAIDEMR